MSEKDNLYYWKNREKILANAKKRNWRQKKDPNKLNARYKIRNKLKSGLIKKDSCKLCGSVKNLEFHHKDYSHPLDVVVLCRKCHKAFHRDIRGCKI